MALTVTTALCADQVVAASPSLRPQVGTLAGRIVSRLTTSFRQTVASERPVQVRHPGPAPRVQASGVEPRAVLVAHRPLSPFQFRLPPPTL